MFNDITVKLPEIVLRLANHMAFRGLMDGQGMEAIRENILYELSLLGAVVTERGPGLWHIRDAESGETCLLSEEEGNYHVEYINHTDSIAAECTTSSSGDGIGVEAEHVREVSEHLSGRNDGSDEGTSGDNGDYVGGADGNLDQGIGGRERSTERSDSFSNSESGLEDGGFGSGSSENQYGSGNVFSGSDESIETHSGSDSGDAIGNTEGYSDTDANHELEDANVSAEIGGNHISSDAYNFYRRDLSSENDELASDDFQSGRYNEDGDAQEGVSEYECSDCGQPERIGSEECGNIDGGDAKKQDYDRFEGYDEQSKCDGSKFENDPRANEGVAGHSGEIPIQTSSGEYGGSVRGDSGGSDAIYHGGSNIHSGEGLTSEAHISADEEELIELAVEKRIKRAEIYAMEMELLQQRKIQKELGQKLEEFKKITEMHSLECDAVARNLSEIKEIENEEKQKLHLFCNELDSVRNEIDSLREKLLKLSDDNHYLK